jgi:plasmid maintenance system killer protein
MIISLKGKVARDIWETNSSRTLPRNLCLRAKALMTIMHSTRALDDLCIRGEPPSIRLHWCITFRFDNGEFSEVKIDNYYRG